MCSDAIHMTVYSFAGRSSALLVCAPMMVEPATSYAAFRALPD